jgi:hypothetical protein
MATLAQDAETAGRVPDAYYELQRKKAVCGTANLVIILTVMSLAVTKPALRQNTAAETQSREVVV